MLEFPSQPPLSGWSVCRESQPQSYRSGALKGNPEDTQRTAPQCCPWRYAGRCLVFDITNKQNVPCPVPPLQQTWNLVGAQRSQGREEEAHPHTWQVVDCRLWFSWKVLKWLSEHSLSGPYILGRAVMTQGVWPATHILWGVLWAALQHGIRTWALRDLLPSQPFSQEVLGPFLFIHEMKKFLQFPPVKRRWSLSFGKLSLRVLTLAKISCQVPKPKK